MEGRVGNHVIGPARQAEIGGVGLYDHDVAEPLPEALCAPGMGLDRDDARTRVEQRGRDRAGAGTDVEDE